VNETRLYGTATAHSWGRLHPRLTHPSAWTAQLGALPVIEGAVIRLQVEHLPSGATPKPVWLWWSGSDATEPRSTCSGRHSCGAFGFSC
jgi:hypothetical protein